MGVCANLRACTLLLSFVTFVMPLLITIGTIINCISFLQLLLSLVVLAVIAITIITTSFPISCSYLMCFNLFLILIWSFQFLLHYPVDISLHRLCIDLISSYKICILFVYEFGPFTIFNSFLVTVLTLMISWHLCMMIIWDLYSVYSHNELRSLQHDCNMVVISRDFYNVCGSAVVSNLFWAWH